MSVECCGGPTRTLQTRGARRERTCPRCGSRFWTEETRLEGGHVWTGVEVRRLAEDEEKKNELVDNAP